MVAFYLPGDMPIYAFPLLLGLGATLGLAWVAHQSPPAVAVLRVNAGLWALLGGLIGARAAYVLLNGAYFQSHPAEILRIYLGGFSWPGALAGGVLALLLVAALTHRPFGILADALLPLAATLSVSLWLACWLDGCAYGALTSAWWALPALDEAGAFAPRVPIQLLGALLSLGLFGLLDWQRARFRVPGLASTLGLLGLSLELFALTFLRADPAPHWLGLRLDAWAALAFAALGAFFLLKTTLLRPPPLDP